MDQQQFYSSNRDDSNSEASPSFNFTNVLSKWSDEDDGKLVKDSWEDADEEPETILQPETISITSSFFHTLRFGSAFVLSVDEEATEVAPASQLSFLLSTSNGIQGRQNTNHSYINSEDYKETVTPEPNTSTVNLTKPVKTRKARKNKQSTSQGIQQSENTNRSYLNSEDCKEIVTPGSITSRINLTNPVKTKKAKKMKQQTFDCKESVTPGNITSTVNLTKPVTSRKERKYKQKCFLSPQMSLHQGLFNEVQQKENTNRSYLNIEDYKGTVTPGPITNRTNLANPVTTKKAKKIKQPTCDYKGTVTPGPITSRINLANPVTTNKAKKIKQPTCDCKETPGPFTSRVNLTKPVKTKKTKQQIFKKFDVPINWVKSADISNKKLLPSPEQIEMKKKQLKENKDLLMIQKLLDKFFTEKRKYIEKKAIHKYNRKYCLNDSERQCARSAKKNFLVFTSTNRI